jgi:hypothetical protein
MLKDQTKRINNKYIRKEKTDKYKIRVLEVLPTEYVSCTCGLGLGLGLGLDLDLGLALGLQSVYSIFDFNPC